MTAIAAAVATAIAPAGPTARWTPMKPHAIQRAYWQCRQDVITVAAGRRSGKTEILKRIGVRDSLLAPLDDFYTIFAAPTHEQARKIFWADLLRLVPKRLVMPNGVNKSDRTIQLVNGALMQVLGMDAPDRIEGRPIDRFLCTEAANIPGEAWEENVFPALYTEGRPQGKAILESVPEGRNWFFNVCEQSIHNVAGNSAHFHWFSSDILPPSVIEKAKAMLDPLTYQQEFEASFITFAGRAYYTFDPQIHAVERVEYDPALPLQLCFDFNQSPGVAVVVQEQEYKGANPKVAKEITAIIGEVYIPKHSNTVRVCQKFLQDWSHHEGRVYIYGDPAGGQRKSSGVLGSDWDLVDQVLSPKFGSKLHNRVAKSAPAQRERLNAVNSRLASVDGTVHMLVDPKNAPNTARDFDGVTLIEGGIGEIDKDADGGIWSHCTDAVGYYIVEEFPVSGNSPLGQSSF